MTVSVNDPATGMILMMRRVKRGEWPTTVNAGSVTNGAERR